MRTVLKEGQMIGGNEVTEALFSGIAAANYADRIVIGRSGNDRAYEFGVISGILSEGKNVISLGRCLETELFFASRLTKCELCIYIKNEPLLKLDLRERGGLPLSSISEKAISSALSDRRFSEAKRHEGILSDGSGFREIYKQHIEGLIPQDCPYNIKISSSSPVYEQITLNRNGSEELVVQLSPDGMKSAIYSEKTGFVSYDKLVFICCEHLFSKGLDVALPFDFTFAAEEFARSKGRHIYRYYLSGDGEADKIARRLAKEQNFTLDGFFLAAKVIGILCEKNIDLKKAVSDIPEFYTAKRFVNADSDRIKNVMNHWEGVATPDGTAFSGKSNRVIVKPSVSGRGIWLSVESHSMEAASELCGEIEERIKRKDTE
ncbi:MAG: hypothetical protein NC320_10250 [Clostridium sp.]|nr:hypothetical protein [Clostridium sp.]MCM1548110.1 hypothetical protein [Ruminococcus sp.]